MASASSSAIARPNCLARLLRLLAIDVDVGQVGMRHGEPPPDFRIERVLRQQCLVPPNRFFQRRRRIVGLTIQPQRVAEPGRVDGVHHEDGAIVRLFACSSSSVNDRLRRQLAIAPGRSPMGMSVVQRRAVVSASAARATDGDGTPAL